MKKNKTIKNNICFFNSTKAWGGGEKWHFEMACELTQHGYNVTIACNPRGLLFQKAKQANINTLPVTISNLSFLNPVKKQQIFRHMKDSAYDTIIINFPADLKTAAPAAKKAGIQNIIYRRGSAIPIKNSWLNRYLFRQVITGLIANSEETKRTINQQANLFPEDNIKVIYNGIDLPAFDQQTHNPVYKKNTGNEIILGNAGRLVKQKGQFHLIDIFTHIHKEVPNTKLLIAGSGKLASALKKYALEKGVSDSIVFYGFVENIKSFMFSIDIFLLTSLWEGFGYVIAEAMACKKAVVAFEISSNPELISHKETGMLIPPFNKELFAKTVINQIKNSDASRKMGEAGRKRLEQNFTREKVTKELLSYLEKLPD